MFPVVRFGCKLRLLGFFCDCKTILSSPFAAACVSLDDFRFFLGDWGARTAEFGFSLVLSCFRVNLKTVNKTYSLEENKERLFPVFFFEVVLDRVVEECGDAVDFLLLVQNADDAVQVVFQVGGDAGMRFLEARLLFL